jgi:hypothetical protein
MDTSKLVVGQEVGMTSKSLDGQTIYRLKGKVLRITWLRIDVEGDGQVMVFNRDGSERFPGDSIENGPWVLDDVDSE